jgi:MFS family permease
MYILGFGILTLAMVGLVFFAEQTPIAWSVVVATVAGIGLGAIPTINTMVVQNAVPKRLMGVAMGAMFFSILMGVAISPALLGSAMNASYAKTLRASLPDSLNAEADPATMSSLGNPRVLLSKEALNALEKGFSERGDEGKALFPQTVKAIRGSMEAGLRSVFWIGAVTMLLAFLIICTIPESSMDAFPEEKAEHKTTSQ